MSRFTAQDVTRIAELARLALTDEERDLYTRQLSDILDYVEQIGALDTTHVPPTSHVLNRPVDRDDEVGGAIVIGERGPLLGRDEVHWDPAGRGQFGDGKGAGPADHQIGPGVGAGHVVDEGHQMCLDAGLLVIGPENFQVLLTGLVHHLGTSVGRQQGQGVVPGLAVKMAIATSMATIMFTSLSSVRAHHRRGAVRWDLVKGLAPGILAMRNIRNSARLIEIPDSTALLALLEQQEGVAGPMLEAAGVKVSGLRADLGEVLQKRVTVQGGGQAAHQFGDLVG